MITVAILAFAVIVVVLMASGGMMLYVTILAARTKRHQVFSHLGRVREPK